MLTTLAISNYRSILNLVVPLGPLNLITGANGSGKSNLYKALRLLAQTAHGGVVNSLAIEGGLESTFWAGPETLSRAMKTGDAPVQGGPRKEVKRLRLGFTAEVHGEWLGYGISLGLPKPSRSAFTLDPEIKRESAWFGQTYRPTTAILERNGPLVKSREGRRWNIVAHHLTSFDSVFSEIANPAATPQVYQLRETIRGWRFYDHFRTDRDAPARQAQLGSRTPVLHHDGRDLAAAIQTILEVGDHDALHDAIEDAFPGATISVQVTEGGYFSLSFNQYGLLRPLLASELSDGTLRYLLLVAALLTPRPPSLMVLNEPETSLHPDLLPALARLIVRASRVTQVWVVSHASRLIAALEKEENCHTVGLDKQLGETRVVGQGMLDAPLWHWMDKR